MLEAAGRGRDLRRRGRLPVANLGFLFIKCFINVVWSKWRDSNSNSNKGKKDNQYTCWAVS